MQKGTDTTIASALSRGTSVVSKSDELMAFYNIGWVRFLAIRVCTSSLARLARVTLRRWENGQADPAEDAFQSYKSLRRH